MLLDVFSELTARLDERLPARRPRRAFRHWRRTRPFWGGAATIAGGVTILMVPLAPLPIMIHVGTAAISGLAIGFILLAAGLFFWFAPAQRAFVAVVSTICALVSVVTSNFGGLGFGALEALLGAAMAFGWKPAPPARLEDSPDPEQPDPLNPADPPNPATSWIAEPHRAVEAPISRERASLRPDHPAEPSGPADQPTGPPRRAEPPRHGAPSTAQTDPQQATTDRAGTDRAEVMGPAKVPTWPAWSGWFRRANAFVLIPVVLAAVAVPARAEARAQAPETVPTCVPVPGATRPWWVPEWLWLICPNPSATPSPTASGPVPPSPTPNPTGPSPTSAPTPDPTGSGPEGSSPSGPGAGGAGDTANGPPGSGEGGPSGASGTPGPGASGPALPSGTPTPGVSPSAVAMTPPPAMANPGRITEIRYGPNVPEVAADRLLATGFSFKGTVDMPTVGGGSVKALVFHADNLKADNYRIGTTDPGSKLTLGIDLDIDDVDIYATYLGGLITVPYLNVPLLDITIGAGLIPTWLPLNISLPLFSGDKIKAGQVFIRAGTVRGSDLSADVSSGALRSS
ncbi:DUF6114 domain-containing protein [Actinoplanes sp. NPDC026619]|uniref:DUF6114 domain-containing protein n=1 Tax=Actinoplanes sp. NPDC026619 TaxID=3155798 RepID=UPI003407995A